MPRIYTLNGDTLATLGGSLMSYIFTPGTDLRSGNFRGQYVNSTSFEGCDCSGADFSNSIAEYTIFIGANLTGARFGGTSFYRAKFNGADLRGAKFDQSAGQSNSDFTDALRHDTDPPIDGWKLDNGKLRKPRRGECVAGGCDRSVPRGRACLQCSVHCSHTLCSSCDCCDLNASRCTLCNTCSGCCECVTCYDCGRLLASCDGCSNHCHCDEDSDRDYDPGEPLIDKFPKKFRCARLCGVEWEYNECPSTDLTEWRRKYRGGNHYDGSCGREAVTAPMNGDYIEKVLGDLARQFSNEGTSADNRCGIHVHVDARDMNWADMYRFLWVYAKIEPVLYLLAGQNRAKADPNGNGDGSYCKPVGVEYGKSLSEIDRKGSVLAVAFKFDNRRHGEGSFTPETAKAKIRHDGVEKKDAGRYRGVNIIPWISGRQARAPKNRNLRIRKKDSTIEFRMHRNSLDGARVIGWTQLCVRIVDWCANASDAEAQALPKSALRALCEVIAPDCAQWILGRVRDWRKSTPKSRRRKRYISLQNGAYALKAG